MYHAADFSFSKISGRCVHFLVALSLLVSLSSGLLKAEDIHVATASNFTETIKIIARNFEAATGHRVIIISGSTGKLYAQIKNGAPFDAYFAADSKRPELLDKEGIAVPDSRFTYAVGKIILWSPIAGYVDPEGNVLRKNQFRHLAIANPKLAPYGNAARQILQTLGLWNTLHASMVRGENIGQAFQFVNSGNAELGFIAYSQVKRPEQQISGSFWEVPGTLYAPIEQQAVLLKDTVTTRAFMTFIQSNASQKLLRNSGYGIKRVH